LCCIPTLGFKAKEEGRHVIWGVVEQGSM